MERQLETYQKIERSIIKKFRKQLWTPFIVAVKRYELIQAGDKIAVCISGGKDSMLMAKLLQELQRHSEVPFELVYLVMDPGYNEINRQKIESNAALLHIPITVFETKIFDVANNSDKSPCYLLRILLQNGKAPDTVCGLVRNIGREGQSAQVLTLAQLEQTPVDMFTTVYIGNRNTRVLQGRMVTPRGYRV